MEGRAARVRCKASCRSEGHLTYLRRGGYGGGRYSRRLAGADLFTLTGQGYDPKGEIQSDSKKVELKSRPALTQILQAGLLCNDTHIVDEDGRRKVQGDPTEAALIVSAEKAGLKREELERELPR